MKALISKLKLLKTAFAGSQPSPMSVVIALVLISLVTATVIAALLVRSTNEATSQRNLADAVKVGMESINIELTKGISQLNAIRGCSMPVNL